MAIATFVQALNVLESTMRTSPPFVRFVGGISMVRKAKSRVDFFIGIPASLQSEFSLTPAGTKNPLPQGSVARLNLPENHPGCKPDILTSERPSEERTHRSSHRSSGKGRDVIPARVAHPPRIVGGKEVDSILNGRMVEDRAHLAIYRPAMGCPPRGCSPST